MSVLPISNKVVLIVDNMILDFFWSLRKPKIKKIGITDAGTPQPDRDLNVENLLVKL